LEGREQVCGGLIKFSINYVQFLKLLYEKSILFGGPSPSPPRGGSGWGHLKTENVDLPMLSVLMIPFFTGRIITAKLMILRYA
jgi:hypothetical protein